MRQRLDDLHAALHALQSSAAADEDAWSDSSDGGEGEGAGPSTSAPAAAPQPAALVETERERQIRMGLITPFQNVAGVATGITREAAPAHAPTLKPAQLLPASVRSAKLAATAKRLAKQRQESEATRPAVKAMKPDELDEDMLEAVTRQEYFKRKPSAAESKVAAEMAKAARFKRAQTLPRGRTGRSAKRRKVGAAGAATHNGAATRRSRRSRSESDDDFSGLEDDVSLDGGSKHSGGSSGGAGDGNGDHGESDSHSDLGSGGSSSDSDRSEDFADDYDDAGAAPSLAPTLLLLLA